MMNFMKAPLIDPQLVSTVSIFVGVGLVGLGLLYLYNRYVASQRTEERACKKVGDRLKHLSVKDAQTMTAVKLRVDGTTLEFDNLLVDKEGILLIKTFAKGTSVHGQPRSEQWKLTGGEGSFLIPNPVLELERQLEPLRKLFAAHNLFNIPIELLAVFADNVEKPQLFLGKGAKAIAYEDLKQVCNKRNSVEEPVISIEAVTSVLRNAAPVTVDTKES